jgi:hypothetical protein
MDNLLWLARHPRFSANPLSLARCIMHSARVSCNLDEVGFATLLQAALPHRTITAAMVRAWEEKPPPPPGDVVVVAVGLLGLDLAVEPDEPTDAPRTGAPGPWTRTWVTMRPSAPRSRGRRCRSRSASGGYSRRDPRRPPAGRGPGDPDPGILVPVPHPGDQDVAPRDRRPFRSVAPAAGDGPLPPPPRAWVCSRQGSHAGRLAGIPDRWPRRYRPGPGPRSGPG